MIIEIGLLTMERNWYPWEFQQIVARHDFQKLHGCCQSESQAFFLYHLQSTCVGNPSGFNEIVLYMTNLSKFESQI